MPPGYKGEVPTGYFAVPSKTNGLWVFMRGYLDKKLPLDKAIFAASANIRNHLKVYSLATRENPPKMEFINVSGKVMNTVLPNDYSYFEKLHALIQGEPDDYLGPEAKGMMAAVDSKKKALGGSKTYKLHLPPNPPAKDFWAVTIYDTQTRSQLQTDQQFPTLGSQNKGLKKNADGSCDIYFAPKAPAGQEKNWLQTIPGKSWWVVLRMYGPEEAWIKQTWRPGEIELVK